MHETKKKREKKKGPITQRRQGQKENGGREARKLDRESRQSVLFVSRFNVRNKLSRFAVAIPLPTVPS